MGNASERQPGRRKGFLRLSPCVTAWEGLPMIGLDQFFGFDNRLRPQSDRRASTEREHGKRASTSRGYAAHMRSYLVPYLGGIPLAALTAGDVQSMCTAVTRDEGALGRPVSAATLHRIHATLRAALNGAVRAGLISANPGRHPGLPGAARPRPQVWTPALTERWQQDGWRPAVGVWTTAQTAQFPAQVRGHRLYALFHLVALRRLRHGEAAGLQWSDLDLDAGTLTVAGQLQQLGGRLVAGPPKNDAGRRAIALDKTTITALREHRIRQQAERTAAGTRRTETGYAFTTVTGAPFRPDRMTRLFAKLVAASGLPPVTLHGPRHGAATIALAADTYTSVLPETAAAGVKSLRRVRREGARVGGLAPRTQITRTGQGWGGEAAASRRRREGPRAVRAEEAREAGRRRLRRARRTHRAATPGRRRSGPRTRFLLHTWRGPCRSHSQGPVVAVPGQ